MAGISRYETAALGLTAAFVLFTGGWFFSSQTQHEPYTVTVQQTQSSVSSSSQAEEPGDSRTESLLEGERIPLNSADVYDLDRLPGIGPVKAQAIVDYREEYGPFRSVEQLLEVSGIGQATLEGLLDYVSLD